MEYFEGETKPAKGCITRELNLLVGANSLLAMEDLLGFQRGRFRDGVAVGILSCVPRPDQFEFAGYNQVSTDRIDRSTFMKGMDEARAKQHIIDTIFSRERLVKVFPFIPHTQGEGYPPGRGIPQWILTEPLPFKIVKVIRDYPNGRYTRF